MIPAWHPHFDVWAFVFVVGFGYVYIIRRVGPHVSADGPLVTRRQVALFTAGLASLWVVSTGRSTTLPNSACSYST